MDQGCQKRKEIGHRHQDLAGEVNALEHGLQGVEEPEKDSSNRCAYRRRARQMQATIAMYPRPAVILVWKQLSIAMDR